MYGIGSVGRYKTIDGTSIADYASKNKSNALEEVVTSTMGKWLSECVENLDNKCPGLVEMVTLYNRSMLSASKPRSKMKNMVSSSCEINASFLAAFLCVNCITHLLHTEMDCAFTAVHVPDQDMCDCYMCFQFSINEGVNVYIKMKPHVSIIYSAYLLTHRQVGTFKKGSKFYNIVAYSNKRLYECARKSH